VNKIRSAYSNAHSVGSERSHLNEDREEDDGDDGRQEHLPHGEQLLVEQEAQREGDGASQAAVGHDELVLGRQLDDAELVDDVGQADHTWGGQA